jgi:predicted metalloprotease with PDZ domain
MRSSTQRLLTATLLGLAVSLGAAPAAEKPRCTADTQECLNYMVETLSKRGWVGLELDNSEGFSRMIVTRVVPGSPAEGAGFKEGDRLVAFNSIEFKEANMAAMKKAQSVMHPGKQVTYRVERGGGMRVLSVTLAAVPDDVLALWVGRHMLEHAQVDVARAQP